MPTGILKRYLADKGYGFITPDDNSGDLFAHIRQKVGDPNEALSMAEGRRVYFESEIDPQKGRPKATTWYFADGGVPQTTQQVGGAGGTASTVVGQAQNPGVAQLAAANGVDYQALVQAATAAAAAMAGQGGQSALLANLANLASQGTAAAGTAPVATGAATATVGVVPTLPPPPAVAQHSVQEVQVPATLMASVVGSGGVHLEEIKMQVGGDVQIELGGGVADASSGMRTLKVRGPHVSASLGACLLLQRVTEVM